MDTQTRSRSSRAAEGEDGADAIDPRIRARRIRVQRDEGRGRLGRLIAVVAVVAVVAGSVAALRSPLLDVDQVVVLGEGRTNVATIVWASGVRRGSPMGGLKLAASSRRVASLPWVLRATVQRRWPGTVRIVVTERQPLAEIRRNRTSWFLVDRTGRLLAPVPAARSGLVQLSGTASGLVGTWLGAGWTDALRVTASLPDDLRPQVASVRRVADPLGRGTGLVLRDGLVIELGTGESTRAKLSALETLLAQPDRHCFASINLQVADAPALTRRPGCV